ncbi:MAG: SRPBCC family protein [Acidimicrobiales bacterium]
MDIEASLVTDIDADALYAVVADLGTYPRWLDIVSRAVEAPAADGDAGPAWSIDLRGQLGPLRRSKRLRMVRVTADAPTRVRFERRELDGRDHSPWVMEGAIDSGPGSSELTMRLHYGGSLWVPMLDRVLRDEIERSRARLVEVARG